jgi:hypothetical protein
VRADVGDQKRKMMKIKWMYLVAAVAMMIFSGCATAPECKGDRIRKLTPTGAIITKQEATCFYYKKKCPGCGAIAEKQVGSGYPKGQGTLKADYTCPKCGKNQKVKIEIN